jgi:hypothetical protein
MIIACLRGMWPTATDYRLANHRVEILDKNGCVLGTITPAALTSYQDRFGYPTGRN